MKKKNKKQTKTTSKKSTKKITKSASKVLAKKSLIENLEPISMPVSQSTEAMVEKLPWDIVNEAFDLFSYAFQENGFEDEEGNYIVDDRFIAMWKSFLCISGWNEDEFWEETHNSNHQCPECKKEHELGFQEKEKQKKDNMN